MPTLNESRLKQRQDEVLKKAFINTQVKPSDIKQDLGRLWFAVLTEQEKRAILAIANIPQTTSKDFAHSRHFYSLERDHRAKVETVINELSEKLASFSFQLRCLKICEACHV